MTPPQSVPQFLASHSFQLHSKQQAFHRHRRLLRTFRDKFFGYLGIISSLVCQLKPMILDRDKITQTDRRQKNVNIQTTCLLLQSCRRLLYTKITYSLPPSSSCCQPLILLSPHSAKDTTSLWSSSSCDHHHQIPFSLSLQKSDLINNVISLKERRKNDPRQQRRRNHSAKAS